MKTETLDVLPGEGVEKIVRSIQCRHECCECGEPAHFKHSYLLPNARSNPASSAYRGDDVSWCSDHDEFTCREHKQPSVDGYSWCATFGATARFAHMFLYWHEVKEAKAA
jgi:hypothetical protein